MPNNLKELLKEIKRLKIEIGRIRKSNYYGYQYTDEVLEGKLQGIKQTVVVVDFDVKIDIMLTKDEERYELWQKIKKEVNIK